MSHQSKSVKEVKSSEFKSESFEKLKEEVLNTSKVVDPKLEIRFIKAYQPVRFDNTENTYFSNHVCRETKYVDLEYIKEMNAVKVSNANDAVIIPVTNIAYICLWTDKHKEIEQQKIKSDPLNPGSPKPKQN